MKHQVRISILPAAVLLAVALSARVPAQAEETRVDEIQQRIDKQEARIDQGINQGQITPGEAAADEARVARIEDQLRHDEAEHGGQITASEQAQLNRELNTNSADIYSQRHIDEILKRIHNEEVRINQGVNQGQITPSEAAADEARIARIEDQLRHDEAEHGGHLTSGEVALLNHELNANSADIHSQRHR